MTFAELKSVISGDFVRYPSKMGGVIVRIILLPQFSVLFWFRFLSWLKGKGGLWKLLYIPLFYYHRWNCTLVGIELYPGTNIGKGLFFEHCGGIVVNWNSIIGENCSIYHGVTIGGWRGQSPRIGNNVLICAGAKVIGGVTIGNNVVVGANAVVTTDVPDGAVVAGIPAKVISMKGDEYTRLNSNSRPYGFL